MGKTYDFSGWATRNDYKCSDGRTIRRNAFIRNDGQKVPLVWNHQHNDPNNVLGHALLENREDGVYAYCTLNDTEAGQNAKELVKHGDVSSLSIYANQLKQDGGDVLHGIIREVSLVLAGANPGAYIDSIMVHGEESEDSAIIYSGEELAFDEAPIEHSDEPEESNNDTLEHAEEEPKAEEPAAEEVIEHADTNPEGKEMADSERTVKDVFDEMTEEQKNVVYFMVGQALEDAEGDADMKHNVFENDNYEQDNYLSHADMEAIFQNAKRTGSLKEATEDYLAHAYPVDDHGNTITYGIANVDYLFPEYKNVTETPEWVKRPDEWVSKVMDGVKKSPFARIKSMFADITPDEARAKGYVKAGQKVEEVFNLMKRTTDPQTIYKKQKMDRDDLIDITDFDVVAWLKKEMRMMLDEEIARAILIGDGRSALATDKIGETHIRPIVSDDDFYSIKVPVTFGQSDTDDQKAKKVIRAAVKARKNYRGSGNPVLFTTEDWLTNMLLMEDTTGRLLYNDAKQLATALRVSDIVTVPVMENNTRTDSSSNVWDTIGVIVNLKDYNLGADKGGAVAMFDDFDIDVNQEKYLIETRCSGALVRHHAAIVLESAHPVTPQSDVQG